MPAGTLAHQKYAYDFGADAVYAGQPRYSMRARNNEFKLEQLQQGIQIARERGKKLYVASNIMKAINNNVDKTQNFHMYYYPSFSSSRVTFENKHLIIGVNLLPLENKKTRWYVTIGHNYYQSPFGKKLMETLASIILKQDFEQMTKQADETELKKIMLFEHVFKDEEVIIKLKEIMKNYDYPSMDKCIQLYKKQMKM